MSIIRVFPRRTALTPNDALSFVGDPPMFRPQADEVHVSVTFTWDIEEGHRLVDAWAQYYDDVHIGGPAMGSRPDGFIQGRYLKPGITFTSRGCNNRCPWCLVREREGKLAEIRDFAEGNIIQDNNLLQCSRRHLDRVFAMLRTQHTIYFSGGLDARLVTDQVADDLRGLRTKALFFASDTDEAVIPLEKAVRKLHMSREKVRCYVLMAFNGTTIDQCEERLQRVWHAGAMPFAQLYQPPGERIDYSKEWRRLQKTWSRPAAMKAHMGYRREA
ncbi:MAG: hypothetical protein JRE40_06675 [Deltaproteobacteria bacterium]|nr:hypothetical protein [Deltaproteobacteria bacterium]